MSDNPYHTPVYSADLVVQPIPAREMKVASQGQRFINLILDTIIAIVFNNILGFIVGVTYGIIMAGRGHAITEEDIVFLNGLGFAIGIAGMITYFFLTEGFLQRSLAKFITGTMVVNEAGGRPTLGQVLGRTCARFIPFEAFSFLGGNAPVGWHDKLSKTRVISLRQ